MIIAVAHTEVINVELAIELISKPTMWTAKDKAHAKSWKNTPALIMLLNKVARLFKYWFKHVVRKQPIKLFEWVLLWRKPIVLTRAFPDGTRCPRSYASYWYFHCIRLVIHVNPSPFRLCKSILQWKKESMCSALRSKGYWIIVERTNPSKNQQRHSFYRPVTGF